MAWHWQEVACHGLAEQRMTIRGMQRVRQAEYLKDLRVSVKDFENLWYSWNVNRFVQISIRDLLTISHLQLDGK